MVISTNSGYICQHSEQNQAPDSCKMRWRHGIQGEDFMRVLMEVTVSGKLAEILVAS